VEIVLKEVRKSKGLSQKRLAEALGMSLQNIQNIEYGSAKSIPLDTLSRLCEVLGCQPGDLLKYVPTVETIQPK
jgi:putative transcriptional regulator